MQKRKRKNYPLTQESLKARLHYDKDTGVFTWIKNSSRWIGSRAGTLGKSGHRYISIGNSPYCEHRLAWLYVTGRWPQPEADHIDRKRDNNKWENLREATRSQQSANIGLLRTNSSGYRGVYKSGPRWRAQIGCNPATHLGSFETKEEAKNAFDEEAKRRWGEFYNP